MKKFALMALVAAGALATGVGVIAVGAQASTPGELQAVKDATARYHSLTQATRNGYSMEGEPCVSAPPVPGLTGAMGIHAVNPDLVQDPTIDPLRPEVLVYLPRANGRLKLVAVEYFAVALANTATGPQPWFGEAPPPGGFVGSPPEVLGRQLDGPMPGHNPAMPWHYDLHLWVWAHNPAGMFAPFNPALTCPS